MKLYQRLRLGFNPQKIIWNDTRKKNWDTMFMGERHTFKEVLYTRFVIPFYELKKYVADTFKPYKTEHQKKREWWQWLSGFGNIAWGLLSITVAFPLMYVLLEASVGDDNPFIGIARILLEVAASPIYLIKGVLQIVMTPFTLLIRKPLRHHLSNTQEKPTLLDNPGMKEAVKRLGEQLAEYGTLTQQAPTKAEEKTPAGNDSSGAQIVHHNIKLTISTILHKLYAAEGKSSVKHDCNQDFPTPLSTSNFDLKKLDCVKFHRLFADTMKDRETEKNSSQLSNEAKPQVNTP